MAERTIYFRVELMKEGDLQLEYGRFSDLKTLKGATARLTRVFPAWRSVEASYEPWPQHFSPPNYREFRLANRRNTLKEVR